MQHNTFWIGIRHIHSNTVSKFTLLKAINDIYNLNVNIEPFATKNVDKTLDTIYDEHLKQIPDIHVQIQEMYDFYN
jgi:hypothetical protein